MKKILIAIATFTMTAALHITCFAAGWQQNEVGYWYENEDGTWFANTWQWIDGNKDGKAECYYFDANGYMLADTITPDGYTVNSDGAWIENGIVQFQTVPTITSDIVNNTTTSENVNDDITETEQYVKGVFEIVNQVRQEEEKSPLEWDDTLNDCATKRAEELAENFSHTRPDNTSCFTIFKEYDVYYMTAGENIAMGQKNPEQVMSSWMNSSGHKANILNSEFGKIGIGCYKKNGIYYWVQMFSI